MKSKQIRKLLDAKVGELNAILAKDTTTHEELKASLDAGNALKAEIEGLKADLKAALELEESAKAAGAYLGDPVSDPPSPTSDPENPGAVKSVKIVSRHLPVKSFTGTDEERALKAYTFGRFLHATAGGHRASMKWLTEHGIETKAMGENDNAAGGALVPTILDNDLIKLVDQYGVFRRNARMKRMTSQTLLVPRRVGGFTARWEGEGVASTPQDLSFDNVGLTAKGLKVLAVYSSELGEDAYIDLGNEVADEIALAMAEGEDNAGFNGNGDLDYGKVIGLDGKFKALVAAAGGTWTTDAHKEYAAGIRYASDDTWDGIVLGDLTKLMGAVAGYTFNQGNAKWYCSSQFFFNVMMKLAVSAGGATVAEIIAGSQTPRFLGYPVEFVQKMPQMTAVDTISVYFGDLRQAAMFGDARTVTLARSTEYRFAEDQIAVRGKERVDINCHDLGNADSTASSRVPGPIAGLATKHA